MIASGWMGSIKTNSTGSPTFFLSQHFEGWGVGLRKVYPTTPSAKLLKRQFLPEKYFCYT